MISFELEFRISGPGHPRELILSSHSLLLLLCFKWALVKNYLLASAIVTQPHRLEAHLTHIHLFHGVLSSESELRFLLTLVSSEACALGLQLAAFLWAHMVLTCWMHGRGQVARGLALCCPFVERNHLVTLGQHPHLTYFCGDFASRVGFGFFFFLAVVFWLLFCWEKRTEPMTYILVEEEAFDGLRTLGPHQYPLRSRRQKTWAKRVLHPQGGRRDRGCSWRGCAYTVPFSNWTNSQGTIQKSQQHLGSLAKPQNFLFNSEWGWKWKPSLILLKLRIEWCDCESRPTFLLHMVWEKWFSFVLRT